MWEWQQEMCIKRYKYIQNESIYQYEFQILQINCHTKHSGPHPLFDNVSETQFYNFLYKLTVTFLSEWANGIAGFGLQKAV